MTDIIQFSRRGFMALPVVAVAACQKAAEPVEMSGNTMGTTYNIVALDHTRQIKTPEVQAAVDAALAKVNAEMSNWDAGSEISTINAADAGILPMSSGMMDVLTAARDVHDATDGQFDVTLGPLVELWGFGAGHTAMQIPSDAAIDKVLATTGQAKMFTVEGDTLKKRSSNAEIILSSIGKGYGVDAVAQVLRDFGMNDFMVEIGGDLYVSGRNPNGLDWQIGIEAPDATARTVQHIAKASNLGMATSGDYRNYFDFEGQRYSHILDAKTGRPVQHTTTSVTVLAENAMLADAWATGLLALGKERGLEIANSREIAALFIERVGEADDIQYVTTQSSKFHALQA